MIAETRSEQPMKQIQISKRVREAVRLMVWDGRSRRQAAEEAGITDKAMYRAMRLPKVKALIAREFAELREGAPMQAYRNIMALGEEAKSEDVRLRSNQWIAGVDGLAPTSRVQVNARVTHGFEGYAYAPAGGVGPIIEGKAQPDGE